MGDEFVINNVVVNITALRAELVSGVATAEHVLLLENQQLKELTRDPRVLLTLSAASMFIMFLVLFIVMNFSHLRVVKNIVHIVLHPQFYTHDPRLKFATRTIFRIPIYVLVPVVWWAIVSTMLIVVPCCIFYFTQSLLLQVKGLPIAAVAAYFSGKVYLQFLVIFDDWVLVHSKDELEIVRREFEIGLGQSRDTFWRMADTTRCTYAKVMTVEEVENFARFRSLEMITRLKILEYSKARLDLADAKAFAHGGAWMKLEGALQTMENDDRKEQGEGKSRFIEQCLLQNVIIVDTHNDSSWKVDFDTQTIVSRRVDA